MTGYRLTEGGRIDRSRRLRFSFDGVAYEGHPGDTLASALLASGVRLIGRSFKYHRPRGLVSAGPEEPNALVTLIDREGRRLPNVPATIVPLVEGLAAESQNRWPRLDVDLLAVNDLVSALIPAGFYYKTFMGPKGLWERLYEPLIRRAAGLGRAGLDANPDRYAIRHDHFDVLVVGAGLAGLAAARAAAGAGARVLLLDQDREPGGATLVDGALAAWGAAMLAELRGLPQAEVLPATTAVGLYEHGVMAALERVTEPGAMPQPFQPRQRFRIIRARRIVLATGALERLIALPGNDRPGVMLATAARAYVRRQAVAPARDTVFFVGNDEAYASVRDLARAGIRIEAVVDPRAPTAIAREAALEGLPVLNGHEIVAVSGRGGVRAMTARRLKDGATHRLHAELLCLSGGYSPQTQLATQGQLPTLWREEIAGFAATDEPGRVTSAGAAAGVFGRLEAARHGHAIGARVAGELGLQPIPPFAAPPVDPRRDGAIAPLWEIRGKGKAFVDLQNDVTADDMRLAAREGYGSIEHAKRYTTHGMGTDQGKIGGLLGAAVLAEAMGRPIAEIGVSRPRPFVTPVSMGALAGADVGAQFKPERRLALHDWHAANGAVFVRIGLWLRPLVYSGGDTGWEPVLEEARAVRRAVGLTDVSSLGKIDVRGPDAAVFLDRIYANTFSTLPVGKARYGLMLREDGIVFDDGTTSRLGEQHFVVTTTTGKATEALEHLEFYAECVWPELDVTLTNIADHWAQFALAGPRAREVLADVVTGLDLSNEAFPFMAAGGAAIAGVPGRVFRISFSGELAYEVAVPAAFAEPVWEALLAAGACFGIRPYGLDALNVLRIEKGHVAGSELNGQTSAADLGLGRMLKKAGDFIGKALSRRPGLNEPNRLALVGVQPLDPRARLRTGAHLVAREAPTQSLGYLTASCRTTEGARDWIGLALLEGGPARHGETLIATSPVHGETVAVEIVSPHRVDPENLRVKA